MRYVLPVLLLSFSSGAAFGQDSRPQLTWSGYVAGSATLFIQGDKVDAQGRSTGDVDRPRADFRTSLPATRITVDMQVRVGRGRVQIVEQPDARNQYAAVVQIDTNSRQPELYRLDFFWNASGARSSNDRYGNDRYENDRYPRNGDNRNGRGNSNRGRGRNAGPGELQWSGDVDNEVLIEVRGQRVSSRVVKGQSIVNEQIDITSPMPRTDANLRLEDVRGRGKVELLEQPNAENRYGALIRIRDEDGGKSPYAFRLSWDAGDAREGTRYSDRGVLSPSNSNSNPNSGFRQDGYARWSGRVDGRVRITLQSNRATSTTISGQPVSEMNADFGGGPGIPNRDMSDVQLRKIRGRGDVRLVQSQDLRNNSALVFDIEDKDGGADLYEVEITWR